MVYEGHDPIIDRTVAIKVINKTSFDDDEQIEAMNRFKREAQAAGKLSHANIVMVYEYGEDENTAFISMEYVSGRTLQDIMKNDTLTMAQVQDFMVQLLDGLNYAHTHHVTHRDIKPANLVYTDEGQIKIMDFGIAKVESSSLTQVGTIMGTPAYMAPELFTGEAVDHRTDLFATAVILYQLLTGLKPFTGDTMSIIMHQVVNVQPPHPSAINDTLPKVLDTLVRKSLSKQLNNRFQSAPEFKKDLLSAFKKIKPETKMPRQEIGTTTDQTILKKKTATTPRVQPIFKPIYLGGAVIILILLAGIVFLLKDTPTPEPNIPTPHQAVISADATKLKSTSKAKQEPVKIISPESKKTRKTVPQRAEKQEQQRTGISINGRRTQQDQPPSGSGIRITSPSRD